MPGILETISQFKEPAAVVASAVAVLTGIAKTGAEFLQSRSQASKNDKLLTKIQGLAMARQALAGSSQEAEPAGIIESELSEAMRLFAHGSKQEKETQAYEQGLSLVQRVFVLYRPLGARAWIAQIICWMALSVLVFGAIGAAGSDETNEFSWETFRTNWADGMWIALLFFLAIFLLSRLWAVSERKKYVRTHGKVTVDKRRSVIGTIVAILYAGLGITAIVVGVTFISSGAATSVKFSLFGLVLTSCGYAVWRFQILRDHHELLTGKKAGFLLLPAVLLVAIVVFNGWGIIDASSKNNILNYWRDWLAQPIIPLILFPFSAIPLFVSIRSWWVVRKSLSPGADVSEP